GGALAWHVLGRGGQHPQRRRDELRPRLQTGPPERRRARRVAHRGRGSARPHPQRRWAHLGRRRREQDDPGGGAVAMDLTKQPPRSPYDEVGGITFLPRTIDKMRALIAGTHGAYNAKTGYSTQLFDLFGVTPDEFEQIVREHPTDEGVRQALLARQPLNQQEIAAWNERSI